MQPDSNDNGKFPWFEQKSILARNQTWSTTIAASRASTTLHGDFLSELAVRRRAFRNRVMAGHRVPLYNAAPPSFSNSVVVPGNVDLLKDLTMNEKTVRDCGVIPLLKIDVGQML